jgi:hypothetical protein
VAGTAELTFALSLYTVGQFSITTKSDVYS